MQVGEVVKTYSVVASSAMERSRQSWMLEACIDLLQGWLNSPKQRESTGCDIKIAHYKAADVIAEMNNFVEDLRRNAFDSNGSLRENVDQSLFAVGRRLRQ